MIPTDDVVEDALQAVAAGSLSSTKLLKEVIAALKADNRNLTKRLGETIAAVIERAALKADNAALVGAAKALVESCNDRLPGSSWPLVEAPWRALRDLLIQPHPGAALLEELKTLREENERLHQERSDALSVKTREGLLASEWMLRTGKAERELATARAQVEALGREAQQARDAALEEAATLLATVDVALPLEAWTGTKRALTAALALKFAERIRSLKSAPARHVPEADVRGLRQALRDLLASADAAWEQNGGGHDWPEAVRAARAVLGMADGQDHEG